MLMAQEVNINETNMGWGSHYQLRQGEIDKLKSSFSELNIKTQHLFLLHK